METNNFDKSAGSDEHLDLINEKKEALNNEARACIKHYFGAMPEFDEIEETLWEMLFYALTNRDNTTDAEYNVNPMWFFRRTTALLDTLSRIDHAFREIDNPEQQAA